MLKRSSLIAFGGESKNKLMWYHLAKVMHLLKPSNDTENNARMKEVLGKMQSFSGNSD